MTKTLAAHVLAALALAAAAATPAFAASAHHHMRAQDDAYGAYASMQPGTIVIENGQYAGADPDANVRLMLRRLADNNDSN
jgi:hypothetical protein